MQVQVLRVKFILPESILRATIEEKGKRNCLVGESSCYFILWVLGFSWVDSLLLYIFMFGINIGGVVECIFQLI